jgi:hypothetical protein
LRRIARPVRAVDQESCAGSAETPARSAWSGEVVRRLKATAPTDGRTPLEVFAGRPQPRSPWRTPSDRRTPVATLPVLSFDHLHLSIPVPVSGRRERVLLGITLIPQPTSYYIARSSVLPLVLVMKAPPEGRAAVGAVHGSQLRGADMRAGARCFLGYPRRARRVGPKPLPGLDGCHS